MTNSLAIFFGIVIAAFLCVDFVFFGFGNLLFLGQKMLELLEWLAIWR